MDVEFLEVPEPVSIGELRNRVKGGEITIGPLLGIALNSEGGMTLSFMVGDIPPASGRSQLQPMEGHPPPGGPGIALIWLGTVLIDGQPRRIAAYRPGV